MRVKVQAGSGFRKMGGELAMAGLVFAVVLMLVLPLFPQLIDLLIGLNFCFSVLFLTSALFLKNPVSFSSFPTFLLMVTLYRLALNVASTRLILTRADAGRIIGGFGGFLVGGDILVGAVIFGILTIVLFLVITKGAQRVAEVAARFSLDALPGLQMAIESDLRAGAVSPFEITRRRMDLEHRSHYLGSLDGAMKFVRGDAIAGLIITVVNLAGGMIIGTLRHGMTPSAALETYGRLTVGDGLVAMIPALLISTAAGFLVVRVGSGEKRGNLFDQISNQISKAPLALFVTAAMLLILAAIPGLPAWPFLLTGCLTGLVGFKAVRSGIASAVGGGDDTSFECLGKGRVLGLDELQERLDELARNKPVLVRETIPRKLSLGQLADILEIMSTDGIGADCLPEILEALSKEDSGLPMWELSELIRRRVGVEVLLGRKLCGRDPIRVMELSEDAEALIDSSLTQTKKGPRLAVPHELADRIRTACWTAKDKYGTDVIFVKQPYRMALSAIVTPRKSGIMVATGNELGCDREVMTVGNVEIHDIFAQ